MKVVHNSLKEKQTKYEWLEQAKELEHAGDLAQAASLYEKVIKADAVHEFAYDRLMIIYRKEKEYKKELALIRAGIKAFEELYETTAKRTPDKAVMRLSKALLRAAGLADKKGHQLYEREPIGRWNRRKKVVEKKLGR